jgi:hypothetical protein
VKSFLRWLGCNAASMASNDLARIMHAPLL